MDSLNGPSIGGGEVVVKAGSAPLTFPNPGGCPNTPPMGHQTSKSYQKLQERLNRHAQGAPESSTLFRILELLFTEEEAELVSRLPFRFFTVQEAAARFGGEVEATAAMLDELADKGILLDLLQAGKRFYVLAPTMAGFFEFSLMRLDGRFNKKVLAELFHQYINQEEDFVRQIFGLQLPIDRVFVQEEVLSDRDAAVILDYERATQVVASASAISVGICYCRHKMQHVGKACKAPEEVCLTFNNSAESLIRHGIAREISKGEALAILARCVKRGLVQIGDNVKENVSWICNCCGCCCEAILAYKRLGYTASIHSSYVVAHADGECTACGNCALRCPVEAIAPRGEHDTQVHLNLERCFGCGVCVRACKTSSLTLRRRSETNYVPVDSFERVVVNAIESGKVQNYLFDNEALWTHTALRRLLGVLLALPPVKQAMANRQLQSRFIRALTQTRFYQGFAELYEQGGPTR